MPQNYYPRYSNRSILTSWLNSPLGALIAKPWFDRLAKKMLARWFFPMSRMWAAARAAEGSVEKFLVEIGLEASPRLERKLVPLLRQFEARRAQVRETEFTWQEAFFGEAESSPEQLLAIELERLLRRNRYNAMRVKFLSLGVSQIISPIQWHVPTPEELAKVYGNWLAKPQEMSALPDRLPDVTTSRSFPGAGGADYWLRFRSPSERMNDVVTARVHDPVNADNPPTLVFGHGICVDFDHWRGLIDEVEALVKLGIRVVRPEAPWHGRRVPSGRFGGEHFIATCPGGPIDHFSAAILEWAVLLNWCRDATTGPVAVGGSSLGAMTAHLVADRARQWPTRLHPDAMLLITHSRGVDDAVYGGKISETWGVKEATSAAGWTPDMTRKFMALLDARGATVVAPENVVSILGNLDDVTPFEAGSALLDEWKVPQENQYQWRRGHFSVPITMIRDHAPLERFRAILARLQSH